jgi:hypothetical protein
LTSTVHDGGKFLLRVDGIPFEMGVDLLEKLINSFVVELKRIEGD